MLSKQIAHTCTQNIARFLHEESCAALGNVSLEVHKVVYYSFGLKNPPHIKDYGSCTKKVKLSVYKLTLFLQVLGYEELLESAMIAFIFMCVTCTHVCDQSSIYLRCIVCSVVCSHFDTHSAISLILIWSYSFWRWILALKCTLICHAARKTILLSILALWGRDLHHRLSYDKDTKPAPHNSLCLPLFPPAPLLSSLPVVLGVLLLWLPLNDGSNPLKTIMLPPPHTCTHAHAICMK